MSHRPQNMSFKESRVIHETPLALLVSLLGLTAIWCLALMDHEKSSMDGSEEVPSAAEGFADPFIGLPEASEGCYGGTVWRAWGVVMGVMPVPSPEIIFHLFRALDEALHQLFLGSCSSPLSVLLVTSSNPIGSLRRNDSVLLLHYSTRHIDAWLLGPLIRITGSIIVCFQGINDDDDLSVKSWEI